MVPEPSQSRPGPMAVMSTLSGFPRPTSGPPAQARPVQDRGSQRILLVLTQTKDNCRTDLVNKDSDLQQAQTVYDYLTVNGHEIWISDFIYFVDIIMPVKLLSGASYLMSSCCSTAVKTSRLMNVIKHSVSSP